MLMKLILYSTILIKIVEENNFIQSNIGVYIQMKWNFINMEKIEEVILTVTHGCMEYKSQFIGLKKESKMRWKLDLDLVK